MRALIFVIALALAAVIGWALVMEVRRRRGYIVHLVRTMPRSIPQGYDWWEAYFTGATMAAIVLVVAVLP